MHRQSVAMVLFLLLILSLGPQSWPQKPAGPAPSSRENERRSFAANVLRALNAAEADYKSKHGSYATWQSLIGEGSFGESGTKFISEEYPTVAHALYGPGPEIVPGWKLRLNLSNNGKSYDALLEDVTDPKCGYAGFTDERGLVRQGKSIACAP